MVHITQQSNSDMDFLLKKGFSLLLHDELNPMCLWSTENEQPLFHTNGSISSLIKLTSSLVVTLRQIKYVWYPQRPTTDQMEKKQINACTTVAGVSRIASANDGLSCAPNYQSKVYFNSLMFIIQKYLLNLSVNRSVQNTQFFYFHQANNYIHLL